MRWAAGFFIVLYALLGGCTPKDSTTSGGVENESEQGNTPQPPVTSPGTPQSAAPGPASLSEDFVVTNSSEIDSQSDVSPLIGYNAAAALSRSVLEGDGFIFRKQDTACRNRGHTQQWSFAVNGQKYRLRGAVGPNFGIQKSVAQNTGIYVFEASSHTGQVVCRAFFRLNVQKSKITLQGTKATFENNSLKLEAINGHITLLKNKITNGVYINNPQAHLHSKHAVLYARGARHTKLQMHQNFIHPADSIYRLTQPTPNPVKTEKKNNSVTWTFSHGGVPRNYSNIIIGFSRDEERITLKMTTNGHRNDLHRLQLGLSGVQKHLDLLLPVNGGLKISNNRTGLTPAQIGETNRLKQHYWQWPSMLNAQLLVAHHPSGQGFYIRGNDTTNRHKGMGYSMNSQSPTQINLVTEAEAPFNRTKRMSSIEWHIETYTGHWNVAAHKMRLWMEQAYGSRIQTKPAWAEEIRLQHRNLPIRWPGVDQATRDLKSIIEEKVPGALDLNASNVLLSIMNWTEARHWGHNFPHYRARADFDTHHDPLVQMGFKTMPWINLQNTNIRSPAYDRFARWHVKDPVTGTEWPYVYKDADGNIIHAYISLAYTPFRNVVQSETHNAWSRMRSPAAAVNIDEGFRATQDINGPYNGISPIEGVEKLYQDLLNRTSSRRLAISSEQVTEVNFKYISFAHIAAYSGTPSLWERDLCLNQNKTGYVKCPNSDNKFRLFRVSRDVHHLFVPLSQAIFGPHVKLFGVQGLDGMDEYSQMSFEAYDKLRLLPTIAPFPKHRLGGVSRQNPFCLKCPAANGRVGLNPTMRTILNRAKGIEHKAPTLSRPRLNKVQNALGTDLRVSVQYRDPDSPRPTPNTMSYVRAVVNGKPQNLNVNASGHAAIQLENLDSGSHEIHFEAWDTWNFTRLPKKGSFSFTIPEN